MLRTKIIPLIALFCATSRIFAQQSGLADLQALPTGTHSFTAGGIIFDAHVEQVDGTGWLLVGRGREGWDFSAAGSSDPPAEVLSNLGTPAAFPPKALSSTLINDLISEAGINLTSVEIRIRRAFDPAGTTYQENSWIPLTQPTWTWDFDDVDYEIGGSPTAPGGETYSQDFVRTRDTFDHNNLNDARRIFTWAWSGHNFQKGFSYGVAVTNGGNGLNDFLWEFATEDHAIPYTEVYIRDRSLVTEATVSTNFGSGSGSLREALHNLANGGVARFSPSLDGQTITLFFGQLTIDKSLTIDASNLPSGLTLDVQSGSIDERILEVVNGDVAITGLTLTGGAADQGGAISTAPSTSLVLERCTLSGNSSTGLGGAIYAGGALTLRQVTIAENASSGEIGGSIWAGADTAIEYSTIAQNIGGITIGNSANLTLFNSIVADNSGGGYHDLHRPNAGSITSVGTNLIGDHTSVENIFPASPFVGTPGSPLNARLYPLADNGGRNATIRPHPGSPAIDAAVSTANPPLTDQRGFARHLGPGIDLGAYESVAGGITSTALGLFAKITPPAGANYEFQLSTARDFGPSISTLAGTGGIGDFDDIAKLASFGFPSGIARDTNGNLFIADTGNNKIRRLSPDGTVTTIAGTGAFGFANGDGLSASFAFPTGLAIEPNGTLYVADTFNHAVRKITPPTFSGGQWQVTTYAGNGTPGFADGGSTSTRFNLPHGLTTSSSGDLFVADTSNHAVRKITPSRITSTVTGNGSSGNTNGTLSSARFHSPFDIEPGAAGVFYIADRGNHAVRQINIATNVVTTLAGGTRGFADGVSPQFDNPVALALSTSSDALFVSDESNHSVRQVALVNGATTTIAGLGTPGSVNGGLDTATFHCPAGLVTIPSGGLIVVDTQNHKLRELTNSLLTLTANIAPGPGSTTCLSAAVDIATGLVPGETYSVRWRETTTGALQPPGQSFTALPFFTSYFVAWQNTHFGSDATTSSIAGPLADPNADGVPNIFHYALGTPPQATSCGTDLPSAAGSSITYTQVLPASEIVYRIEASADLVRWSRVATTDEILSDDGTLRVIRATAPADPARRFLRLALDFPQQ